MVWKIYNYNPYQGRIGTGWGGVGWGGVRLGGSKKSKPISVPPRGARLKSCSIFATTPLRGGENLHGVNRGGAGQVGWAKLPKLEYFIWINLGTYFIPLFSISKNVEVVDCE